MDKLSYRCHRFPSIVIQQAVWLYFRFALSYRDVEDLLAELGGVASAGGLNASDQHPSQARSGLSDNAPPPHLTS